MAYWIHCNSCYVRPEANSGRQFHLTSCGHMYCDPCLKSGSSSKCRVCGTEFTTTPLCAQMREEVRNFFCDPDVMIAKALQVLQFQQGHQLRYDEHLQTVNLKYQAIKTEYMKLQDENRSLRKKMNSCQQELAWYKMDRQRIRDAQRAATQSSRRGAPAPDEGRGRGDESPAYSSRSTFGPPSMYASSVRSDVGSTHTSMRQSGSGLGSSRLTMAFRSTPVRSQDSPLSVGGCATPRFSGSYRDNSLYFGSTPGTSTPGTVSCALNESCDTPGVGYSACSFRRPSPPTRGTPTSGMNSLSLAYSKKGR